MKNDLRYMFDVGRAFEKLKMVNEEMFHDNYSKHNEYFHSVHEVEGDKLHDLRVKLSLIQEHICVALHLLREEHDEE